MIFLDKLKRLFNINKKVFVFLLGVVIIGVLFGSILPIFLSVDDKKIVSDYLLGFVSNMKDGFDSIIFLKNGLFSNGLFLVLIWLLGVSIIGIPIVLFLFFYKCFIFGFSISSIVMNYGFKGIVFSFSYIFPHHVINIFIYLILTSYSLIFSIKLLCYVLRKIEFNIRNSFRKYFKIFIFCFIILIISVLYESFINPYLLSFIFNLLGI